MRVIVVLFTRDLRVNDHPGLARACQDGDRVVPLFVADPALSVPANRGRFLRDCLTDLRANLRQRGGDLVVRQGDPVEQAMRLCSETSADTLHITTDYSRYARNREHRLELACSQRRVRLRTFAGHAVIEPGELRPSTGGDHYKVFTPYWNSWMSAVPRPDHTVATVRLPESVTGDDPEAIAGVVDAESPGQPIGGETAALRRWDDWRHRDIVSSGDDLAADATTRLSPYLHFGCLSAAALATDGDVSDQLRRQLCWRDFHLQVLAAFPLLPTTAYRPRRPDSWVDDPDTLHAWQRGETGVAIVDAGMRQLLWEGWMPNRARLIAAAYLTRLSGIDWRLGAAWFDRWLVDADVANNYGNWQWVAGTGNDTRPNRTFNLERQAAKYDPSGDYVARWGTVSITPAIWESRE